jgi:membrane protease subunit (stomatin/prohibitin family)
MGWKYGFNSPFKADVFFVSSRQFVDQKWGTKNAITLNDARFGMFELRAFGTFAFRVVDAGKFLKEVTGTESNYTTDQVGGQLRSMIVTRFTDAIGEANFPIEALASNLNELSELCAEKLNAGFDSYGLKVTQFLIENVSMPDDVKKEIFEYSRLNKIDLQKLAQFKAAKSIEDAAKNEGIGGTGVGLGVGVGMGKIMSDAFTSQVSNIQQTPPPLMQFFVAVNGQQTGPFSLEQMSAMAQKNELKRDSLVWRAGMAQWAQAQTISDLTQVFNSVPPPPPPAG